MRDTWHCRVVPRVVSRSGSLGTRGVTGVCPGKSTRETRVALGGFRGISFARLVAHSEASGRVLSAWVLGTHGVLARHPEGSLGVALGVGFSGTRGEVGRHPEGSLGLGFRDTWLTRNTSGRGLTA